ncbi:MAG: long-chain fatty acid--CoA ligase [Sphingomonadaceae bacterium]|nr:long-chain fatty acid--CoA ligase [Sphingomonadaceae bacterium]
MRRLEQFPNLVTMFFARAAELGDAPFLLRKEAGAWRATSWRETAQQVASLAAGLTALGLKAGDRVLLVAENRPEWCIADLAIMAARCVTVPAYTSNTAADHAHVLRDSGAAAAIVSTEKLARPILQAIAETEGCRHLVAMEPVRTVPSLLSHDWSDLIATPADPATCADAVADVGRQALACLIYTSGTGGAPKSVMQHHGAILHNVAACAAIIAEDFGWGDERFLSFLPLSHAYEHSAGQFLPIGLGAQIWYAESVEKLAANMEEARPTIMVVVPRLLEVLRQRIAKLIAKQGRLARWLLRKADELARRELSGQSRATDAPLRLVLNRTLRTRIAQRFGGALKALVSGGAPLDPDVGTFFHALGVTLLQGYGQTEAAPVIACNRPAAGIRMETVGPPLDATEVRIAEDGEILVRGELVTQGYWRNEAETARAFDGGWLKTGDIGRLDARGRLVITDRKKDIIVTDKGENVAPQRIEAMLNAEHEIAQAMVSGDRRPYLVGLIVADAEWGRSLDEAARRRGVQAAVDRVNKRLSTTEKVRRVALADEPFEIANGQLTPSLKIRRHMIRAAYGDRLDALYSRSG